MASVRSRYLPLPYQDSPDAGRLILRDGTTAAIHIAHPSDRSAMTKFFVSLSKAPSTIASSGWRDQTLK